MITQNIVINPTLFPIIGENNKVIKEISKRFTKYYKKGIKSINRNKILGYNLIIPKSFGKFKAVFREDLMMMEIKVSNNSSILVPSFYTKKETLKELFRLKRLKSLKKVYVFENNKYKINLNLLKESDMQGRIGGVSTTVRDNRPISLGFGDDISEKDINQWLKGEFGRKKSEIVIRSLVDAVPGSSLFGLNKGLKNLIGKVFKGKETAKSAVLAAENTEDLKNKTGQILNKIFLDDGTGKAEFVSKSLELFSIENPSPTSVQQWAQDLCDIDCKRLVRVEKQIFDYLEKDLKNFWYKEGTKITSNSKMSYFNTIDKFKKKVHDAIDQYFDDLDIDKKNMQNIDQIKPRLWSSARSRLMRFVWKSAAWALLFQMTFGSSPGRIVAEVIVGGGEQIVADYLGIDREDIENTGPVEARKLDIGNNKFIFDNPEIKKCVIDKNPEWVQVSKQYEFEKKFAMPYEMIPDFQLISLYDKVGKWSESEQKFVGGSDEKLAEIYTKSKLSENQASVGSLYVDKYEDAMKMKKDYSKITKSGTSVEEGQESILDYAEKNDPIGALMQSQDYQSEEGKLKMYTDLLMRSNIRPNIPNLGVLKVAIEKLKENSTDLPDLKIESEKETERRINSGIEDFNKKFRKIGEECKKELEDQGISLEENESFKESIKEFKLMLEDYAEESVKKIRKIILESFNITGESVLLKWIDKFIEGAVKKVYDVSLRDKVKDSTSEETAAEIGEAVNDRRTMARIGGLFWLCALGGLQRIIRRGTIGKIAADVINQRVESNNIFNAIYVINAVRAAQATVWSSSLKATQDSGGNELSEDQKKWIAYLSQLNICLNQLQVEVENDKFVVKITNSVPKSNRNSLADTLSFDEQQGSRTDEPHVPLKLQVPDNDESDSDDISNPKFDFERR